MKTAKIHFDERQIIEDIYNSVNLLEGVRPIIDDGNGNENLLLQTLCTDAPSCYTMLTDNQDTNKHIDIFSKTASLTYDMGQNFKVDKVSILGFNAGIDYGLAKFEIYLSNDIKTLYEKENCVLTHDNYENIKANKFDIGADFYIKLVGFGGRFFGLKILKANPTDDIIRLSCLSVYNDEVNKQKTFIKKFIDKTVVLGDKLEIIGGNNTSGLIEDLVDGIVFKKDKQVTVVLPGQLDIIIPLNPPTSLDAISVFGLNVQNMPMSVYINNTKDDLFETYNLVKYNCIEIQTDEPDCQAVVLHLNGNHKAQFVGLRIYAEQVTLDQISIHNYVRKITINQDVVINDNFLSTGVNCLPMALMEESLAKGYNLAYWELEKKRIIDTKPCVVRMWFQVDWFVTEHEDYLSGNYHFDTDKMKAVYAYLDVFKEAGSEIELNFGMKASEKIQSWYSFKEPNPEASAPKDLVNFAKACAATIRELHITRGYTNIKYLSFSNEPSLEGDYNGPFKDSKEQAHYWRKMVDLVDLQLRKEGIRDIIQIWGAEQVGVNDDVPNFSKWIEGEDGSPLEVLTSHWYGYSYEEYVNMLPKLLAVGNGKKPHVVTEHGIPSKCICWRTNHTSTMLAITNYGGSGCLVWCLCGVDLTDPLRFRIGWNNDLFGMMDKPDTIRQVFDTFYPWALYSRYVPSHSKVLLSNCPHDDIRFGSYVTDDGEMTLMVEIKDSSKGRKLSVDLGKNVNKTFYKHVFSRLNHYTRNYEYKDGNAIIPISEKEIFVGDVLEDTIEQEYAVIVYTTMKPYIQVVMNDINPIIKAGESVQLKATVVDGDDSCNGEFEWVVSVSTGLTGTVDKGVYTADINAKSGDTVAVKATLKSNPKVYGVSIISIF